MFPTSGRIKLNRVTLKDVIGVKLAPRRRRAPKQKTNISTDATKLEQSVVTELESEEEEDNDEPPRTSNAHRKVPGNGTDAAGDDPGEQLGAAAAAAAGCKQTGPDTKDINQNARTNPTGPAGSEGYLRRSVGGSYCGVCGVTKYTSPHRKSVGKQRPKRSSPGSAPPSTKFRIKTKNGVVETSEKIAWINQYARVTLCDIAKKCDACSHNCSLLLPDAVKSKTIHCFKLDMSAGFRFWPCCLGHNTHENEERGKCCSNVPDEMNICRCPSPSGHTENLEEATDSQPQSTGNAHRFCNSWASEDSAACSASILIGKHLHQGKFRNDMRGGDAEEKPGPGSQNHRDKIAKLEESGECSSTCRSPVKENCILKKSCDQRGDPTETNATHTSPKPLCDKDDMDTADPESFTCQRVKGYVRKISYSCARTYMSWPFLKGHLACKAHDASTASSAGGCIHPSAPDSNCVTSNQILTCSSSKHTQNMLPGASLEKRGEDSESVFVVKNGNGHSNSSDSDRTNMAMTAQMVHTEESVASLRSDTVSSSVPSQHAREPGVDSVSNSPFACKGSEIDSSTSTPSPSALGLSDSETAAAFSSIPDPYGMGVSRSLLTTPPSHPPSLFLPREITDAELKSVDKILYCEEPHLLSDSSLSPTPPNTSPFLPQDHCESNEFLPQRSPSYYNLNPFNQECPLLRNINEEPFVMIDSNEFMPPPVLSPVTSPQHHLWRRSPSCQRTSVPHEEEQEELDKDVNKSKTLPKFGCAENSNDCHDHNTEEVDGVSIDLKSLDDDDDDGSPVKPQSSPSTDEDIGDSTEEGSVSETNYEQVGEYSEKRFLDAELKATLGSPVLSEAHSCASSDKDSDSAFSDEGEQDSGKEDASSPSQIAGSGGENTKARAAGGSQPSILDEFAAYEQDILLVDVNRDDPELFDNLPEQSLLRLGPVRVPKAPERKPTAVVKMLSSNGASVQFEQRLTPVNTNFHCDSPHITEESDSRPWRPRSGSNPTTIQKTCPTPNKETRHVVQFDANNNHVERGLESNRSQPTQMSSSPHSIPPLTSTGNGPWIKNSTVVTDFRHQKSSAYCRLYFSESLSCGFKMCRFQHLPIEGDEKFCVETVARFTKIPLCLHKAGTVFTGYYHNNPPGVYFSMPVFLSLLWALLKAGMVSEVFSVLGVSLAHSIVPGHEFLLALFNLVREKGLMGFVPELMQLTFKMASVGLELSFDCLDCVKNVPVFHQTDPNSSLAMSANNKLSPSAPFPEYLNLAHAIVEIELCTKQEDWKRTGEVFRSICQSTYHPNQVERISGRIAIALLSESKDKLSLPFTAFAETVCQNEGEDSLLKSFVGRIGVSLMLRYHKTHQWPKGRKVVETMSVSKVNYTTLKGLFGNEDGTSRCHLVTVATELFMLSGSVEASLNTLRDLESRTRVLMRLAEKTSHRDTLEVLCNLPGIKEPNDAIDVSRYTPLFNSHLKVCVERQILPVASDTVDLMFSKSLAVDHSLLQTLLQKLGKQNLWLRAREVFRHSLRVGYYAGVSAPAGLMALIVPCGLGEVELALTFEIFISVNASLILALPETATTSLVITLKRTQSCESDYLTAGSRLLSAACIPQPKLIIHYTAVNSSQEQVFRLDVSSARRWLRHNHLWANEVWAH